MNPILLRYMVFALMAAIFGAGGGYLAVNNKKASPPAVTPSGAIPAIPARPFPGQEIPAIPAIPAVPPDKTKSETIPKEPVINWIWPILIGEQIPLAINYFYNQVGAGKQASITGLNFFSSNNTINWDGKPMFQVSADRWLTDSSVYFLLFTVPSDAKPGEVHTVSITTPMGTSEPMRVSVVEYLEEEPVVCGLEPSSGKTGTEIEVCLKKPKTPYRITEETYYMYLWVPARIVRSDADPNWTVKVWFSSKLKKIGEELYSVQIPGKVVYCPNFIASPLDGCTSSAVGGYGKNIEITLPSGTYQAKVYYRYVFPYKTLYGIATEPGLPYYNDWTSQFTLTVQ